LLQTLVANLVAPAVIGPAGFPGALLLSVPVVIGAGNSLLVHFSASGDNPGGGGGNQTFFRLFVDGGGGLLIKRSTFTHGGGAGAGPGGQSTSIVAKIVGLVAGAHTVDVFWAASAGASTITPAAGPGGPDEHATLLVEEVSV
jgi:hypothetical protein